MHLVGKSRVRMLQFSLQWEFIGILVPQGDLSNNQQGKSRAENKLWERGCTLNPTSQVPCFRLQWGTFIHSPGPEDRPTAQDFWIFRFFHGWYLPCVYAFYRMPVSRTASVLLKINLHPIVRAEDLALKHTHWEAEIYFFWYHEVAWGQNTLAWEVRHPSWIPSSYSGVQSTTSHLPWDQLTEKILADLGGGIFTLPPLHLFSSPVLLKLCHYEERNLVIRGRPRRSMAFYCTGQGLHLRKFSSALLYKPSFCKLSVVS